MHKTVFLLWALLLLNVALTHGQARIYVSAIGGSYSMNDLKALQAELGNQYRASSGVPLKVVHDFPISLHAELGMLWGNEDRLMGGYTAYTKTEGKMHYADYSGEIALTQELTRIAMGFKAILALGNKVHFYGKVGLCYTLLDVRVKGVFTGTAPSEDVESFASIGATLEPGIQWDYPWHRFVLSASGGYELNFNGQMTYNENSQAYLINSKNEKVKANWSGIRAGLTVAFLLRKP